MEHSRDRASVEALIQQYRPLVHAVARRSFPASAQDPDLLQCGLIGLWEAAERWDGTPPFAPLARRCIKNNMLDHLRTLQDCLPLRQTPPAALGAEAACIETIDLLTRIRAVWPPRSRERHILIAITTGVPKPVIAAALGLDTYQVTRIARRAWAAVNEKGDP